MKKTISLLIVLTLVTISAAAFCGSPEDAVKGMIEAVKAKDWEKAVSYIDFEGMAKAMKEMMAGGVEEMDEETQKQMDEEMASITPEKMKEQMINSMKEDVTNFTYKIIETKDVTEDKATVIVEITEEGEEPEEIPFPVRKVDGKWMINFADAITGEM